MPTQAYMPVPSNRRPDYGMDVVVARAATAWSDFSALAAAAGSMLGELGEDSPRGTVEGEAQMRWRIRIFQHVSAAR
eukprot:337504-Alexandrium_andersonii.AAC.1